jgi:hypothetical protein
LLAAIKAVAGSEPIPIAMEGCHGHRFSTDHFIQVGEGDGRSIWQ